MKEIVDICLILLQMYADIWDGSICGVASNRWLSSQNAFPVSLCNGWQDISFISIGMSEWLLPVLSIILQAELVQDHLGEPGNVGVQRVEARLIREDAIDPRSVGLRERWDLGGHVPVLRSQ